MRNAITSDKLSAQISAFQSEPLKIGDKVLIKKSDVGGKGGSSQSPDEIVTYTISEVHPETVGVSVKSYNQIHHHTVDKDVIIKKEDYRIGIDPLKSIQPRINYYNIDIDGLTHRAGFNNDGSVRDDRKYIIDGIEIKPINWNPWVIDANGNKQYYQRDFVWDWRDEKKLIESIYNEISIGTFLFRHRSYSECEKLIKSGETDVAFMDIVDGKQRLHTLIRFIANKFAGFDGYFFGDFSEYAKRKFFNYSRLSFGQLEEDTPDRGVINTFLNVNFAGKPMSQDHINFVKSLNV